MTLSAGEKAPDFDLPTDGGGRIRLADLTGRKTVVYFYPKDDTSGCTRQALDFTQLKDAFQRADVTVIGVSADNVASHDRFKKKHGLDLALASDETKTTLDAFGVWVEKSMYGRKYMGVERSTFLIGPNGRIVRIWRKVKVPEHAEEVLAAAKAI